MKKLIKQQIIKERPYKKNEAIEFWRRQRLQIKASRNSNSGSDGGEAVYFKSQEFDL
jgi:ribosomal protein L19E